jgi:hypothetical protein
MTKTKQTQPTELLSPKSGTATSSPIKNTLFPSINIADIMALGKANPCKDTG